jgi:MFS family permease
MTETVARRGRADDVLHNFVALGLDYGAFLVGMSFASQATILPAFAAHLGAPNVVIGAIPAVMMLGWFLPSLFTARHTETLLRKLPFILRYTVWERVPLPALAAVAFFVAEPAPGLALATLLLLLLLMSGVGGALMPAWMDVVGRAIPTTVRGRFFGLANLLASAGGLAGSLGTAYWLATLPAPESYGVCFLAGSVFLFLSYLALRVVREPEGVSRDAVPLVAYLRGMPGLLRADRNLAWFLAARGVGTVATLASGFYTVHALRAYEAAEWRVGVFTTLYLGGQAAGNLALGWLADRAGHRIVLALGMGALAAANVAALVAPSVEAFGAVFALAGVHHATIHVSARTILLEFARDARAWPTYVGLFNTALAPFTVVPPLVAGVAADRWGFEPVFVAGAVLGIAALGLLLARVREPRRREAGIGSSGGS